MIKRNLNFASTTLELPEYVECLTQTQIDDIRKKSNINKKIVGIGVHPVDKNISLVVATGEVKIFNAAEFYIPESVNALTTKEGPYTHDEILLILAGSEWTDPNPDLKA